MLFYLPSEQPKHVAKDQTSFLTLFFTATLSNAATVTTTTIKVQSLEKENTDPFFRGKWKVMSGEAELYICVVTRELLLSKGESTWKETNGPCSATCNLGIML